MKTSRVLVTHFLFSLAAAACALAQELPDYYGAELRKIPEMSKRAELEAALKTVHRPGNISETRVAVRTILNSHQEDLVFLLFTNQNLSLGVGDTWADNDLRLLTRAMIHTIESHIISYELSGARVARISERILEILKRNGVRVDEGYHVMDDALTPKGFVWLEKWLQRAKNEAAPGSTFYVAVEDCLQLAKTHHQRFLRKLDEGSASVPILQDNQTKTAIPAARESSPPSKTGSKQNVPRDGFESVGSIRALWHWGLGFALIALSVVLFFKLR